MSDYNQAPAPAVTESDMNFVRSIFERMANSVVEASRAAPELANLRSEVEAFRKDVQEMRTKNSYLDEELTKARSERDAAKRDADEIEDRCVQLITEKDQLVRSLDQKTLDIQDLSRQTSDLRRERDDAQMRNMELEDQLKAERDRWSKLQDLFQSLPTAPTGSVNPAPKSSWDDPISF